MFSRASSIAWMLCGLVLLAVPGVLVAAGNPPALINYQGVLRGPADEPLTGPYDMVFRFFAAETLGDAILLDHHMLLSANQVVVEDGLFSVALGGGLVTDGVGPGTYTSLTDMFRDYSEVWLEVQIGTETLAPRTRVLSTGYALNAASALTSLNATLLNGQPSVFYLDTSSTPQTKNGVMTFRSATPGRAVLEVIADPGSPVALLAASSTSSCKVGYGHYGLECYAPIASFFGNTVTPISAYAYLAYSPYGILAGGSDYGGQFVGTRPNSSGVEGRGPVAGGHFINTNTGAEAYLGSGNFGIETYALYGGYFAQTSTSTYATTLLGYTGYGVYAQSTNGLYNYVPSNGSWSQMGIASYKIRGTGSVSFVQNHPDEPEKVVTYHAPESSEVNVYTRGSARLEHGVATVALDPTFAWTANPDLGLTAHLTPRGQPVPLAVESVSSREIVVRGPAGSDVAFDFWVTGLRIGFEEMPPVGPKEVESAIPRDANAADLYAAEPALRSYNALHRYQVMEKAVGRNVDPDLRAATALRDRIGIGRPTPMPEEVTAGSRGKGLAGIEPTITPAALAATPPAAPGAPEPRPSLDERPVVAEESHAGARRPGSERFPTAASIEPGDVVVIDPEVHGAVRRSDREEDRTVVGIALSLSQGGWVEVASGSVATVRVDAGYGAVRAGDLLVSSPAPGTAMRATAAEPGTILGKALEPLQSGLGMIRVLVMLR